MDTPLIALVVCNVILITIVMLSMCNNGSKDKLSDLNLKDLKIDNFGQITDADRNRRAASNAANARATGGLLNMNENDAFAFGKIVFSKQDGSLKGLDGMQIYKALVDGQEANTKVKALDQDLNTRVNPLIDARLNPVKSQLQTEITGIKTNIRDNLATKTELQTLKTTVNTLSSTVNELTNAFRAFKGGDIRLKSGNNYVNLDPIAGTNSTILNTTTVKNDASKFNFETTAPVAANA